MNSLNINRTKLRTLFENLQIRALVYSLLIHLSILLIYIILNYSNETSTYDFGSDTSFSSMPQSAGKPHKKLSVSEAPKEIKKTEKGPEGTEKSVDSDDQPVSSEDAADIANASDLSFFPNATSPHMMGSLKQYYPELARQLNVEAAVYVSLVINKSGKIIKVKVSKVVLSRKLPADRETDLKKKFADAITRSLKEVHFSQPMIDGKNIPIEMEQVVRYKLN